MLKSVHGGVRVKLYPIQGITRLFDTWGIGRGSALYADVLQVYYAMNAVCIRPRRG